MTTKARGRMTAHWACQRCLTLSAWLVGGLLMAMSVCACADNASQDWAQTSPVIPPSPDERPSVIGSPLNTES